VTSKFFGVKNHMAKICTHEPLIVKLIRLTTEVVWELNWGSKIN